MNRIEMALKISSVIHDECKDVPHDIGSRIMALVDAFYEPEIEPYFGWCDVEGCDNEGCSGGNAWRETGYWTVCSKHSAANRKGETQPKMKQEAIDRENSRGTDGILPFKQNNAAP